ncbi:MAG: Bcr/CflA family drug resistance efflux transporter [Azospira oryzae]|jgi:DHA1 family bicyclomycin/chloramphenicol resistance-like MFS transporter|nr:MAG: Bcr/CflA family drug resistance efflux transporter [Azospira oryzae]
MKPPPKPYIIWILGALYTVTPFSIDLYLPAFAQIADALHTTQPRVSLSVSSYFIGMAIGQMLYGPLLDRYGRKPPLYAGLVLFIMASIGCSQSSTVDVLIAFRLLQALGGSVASVAAMAMVRDFYPVERSATIFSLLVLILSVSPMLAPTVGGFIAKSWGWGAVFMVLALMAVAMIAALFFVLPVAYEPDTSVSLRAGPMLRTFFDVLKQPQFYTYAFAGAFSFAALFVYVAGSPIIFMEIFKITPERYGVIFAGLSVGIIGGSQLNILLTRRFKNASVFRVALVVQVMTSILFVAVAIQGWLTIYTTLAFIFICLSCIGIINPNAAALSLAPFTRNIGSASALMGFTQIGIAALASSGVGLLNATGIFPIALLMAIPACMALAILIIGQRTIKTPVGVSPSSSEMITH